MSSRKIRGHLDLFAGIGGMSLGLERSKLQNVTTARICEKDPKARMVLDKHYPGIPKTPDIKELKGNEEKYWIITGGFPCQDISGANPFGKGLKGSRSGLWSEFHRIIKEAQPEWVIIENSPNLRTRGLSTVLQDLRKIGYLGIYTIIGGLHIGTPHTHKRERLWIVAHPMRSVWRFQPQGYMADTYSERWKGGLSGREVAWGEALLGYIGHSLSKFKGGRRVASPSPYQHSWEPPRLKPRMGRSSSRLPSRVDRLRMIGNSVIPDIPEAIGNAINLMEKEKENAEKTI